MLREGIAAVLKRGRLLVAVPYSVPCWRISALPTHVLHIKVLAWGAEALPDYWMKLSVHVAVTIPPGTQLCIRWTNYALQSYIESRDRKE